MRAQRITRTVLAGRRGLQENAVPPPARPRPPLQVDQIACALAALGKRLELQTT